MSSIFISHSSRDDEVAAEIRERLMALGHRSIFLDFDPADGIPAGRSWEQELYAQLRSSQAVLVLCSPASMASDWVFAEITHARALGKHVVPVLVEPCEVRPLLTDSQIVDLTHDREANFERLWSGLRQAGLDPRSAFDWDSSRPPYPGLLAFQENDAAIFFGRGSEISEGMSLLHRLRRFGGTRWLLTLGASGSGKSSLVRAGIIPRLRRNAGEWSVVGPFRPLEAPVAALAAALAEAFGQAGEPRAAADLERGLSAAAVAESAAYLVRLCHELGSASDTTEAGVVLVVDQFEESLAGTDGHQGSRFLELLRAASEAPNSPIFVLATLRSDFLGDFQGHRALRELAFVSLPVGPLSTTGFGEVIEGPAKLAGIELEPGLVQTLVLDTETDDALPLLAFTLRELWEGADNRQRLTVAEYRDRLGGLGGSVARAADSALGAESLADDEESNLRSAFLAMTRIDEDGNYVRRPASWSDLPPASQSVLERFVAARLLISRGDSDARQLEVAHEALLRVWSRLAGWLAAARAFLLWRKRLGAHERAWQREGRARGYLLRGPELGEAAEWLAKRPDLVAGEDRTYIEASAGADRRRRYRVVGVLALVAAALGVLALDAHRERRRAERTRVGATDITKLAAARRLHEMASRVPFAAAELEAAAAKARVSLARPEIFAHSLDVDSHGLAVLAMSPDLMAVGLRAEHGADIYSTLDERWRVRLDHSSPVSRMAVSGAGDTARVRHRSALTASADGVVRLWRLPDFQPVIDAVLENPNLRELDELTETDGSEVRSLTAQLAVEFAGHQEAVAQLAFSADDRYAVTLGRTEIAVWRPQSAAAPVMISGHQGTVTWAQFSPKGERLVTTGSDQKALVWDLDDLLAAPLVLGHDEALTTAAFSADGSRVLTATLSGKIWEWSINSLESELVLTLDCAPLEMKYTATAGHAAAACPDGTARIMDLAAANSWIFR